MSPARIDSKAQSVVSLTEGVVTTSLLLLLPTPDRFLLPIAFQQTNRPVPVVYSLNTEFQLCNNEKVFLMDPAVADMSMAEMDYKGAFSMGTAAVSLIYTK